jgi:hypothetical protein
MCLPPKSDDPASSNASQTRTVAGIGTLMLLACLAGPAIGALVGAAGAVLALAFCFAAPAAAVAWRRRSHRL